MAVASDNVFPRVILGANSADQAAPTDSSWRVYSKVDGIYARSSNATVGPFGAGTGSLAFDDLTDVTKGTAFPGSPATNHLCFRTDLGLAFYYDGTRWLSWTLYRDFIGNATITTTGVQSFRVPLTHETGLTIWMVAFYGSTFVATTSNSSNKYVLDLQKLDTANSATTIVSIDTGSDSADTWVTHRTAIGSALTPSTNPAIRVNATKTGTPGSCTAALSYGYRLIAT